MPEYDPRRCTDGINECSEIGGHLVEVIKSYLHQPDDAFFIDIARPVTECLDFFGQPPSPILAEKIQVMRSQSNKSEVGKLRKALWDKG